MLRATVVAMLAFCAAAGVSRECMKALRLLKGESDVELMVRCRAAFGPEVCKQARISLGTQPWTRTRMKEGCRRFASAYKGLDARALEAAVSNKATRSVDASAQGKPNITANAEPTENPEPQGVVASLLGKLRTERMAKEAAEQDNKEEDSGPVDGGSPFQKFGESKMEAGAVAKTEGDQQEPPGLLTDRKQKPEAEQATAAASVKLYGGGKLQLTEDSSKVPQILGVLIGVASFAVVTSIVGARLTSIVGARLVSTNRALNHLDVERNTE